MDPKIERENRRKENRNKVKFNILFYLIVQTHFIYFTNQYKDEII